MATIETLIERNAEFVAHDFTPNLTFLPNLRAMLITCADHRVDPAHILGLALGDAVVIRNIGGRITPATLQMMGLLGMVTQAEGINMANGLNLVILHHTDCGITRLVDKT